MRPCNPILVRTRAAGIRVQVRTASRRARRKNHRKYAGTISRQLPYSAEARRCRSATKSVLFFWTVQSRSRWRLCRLTDAAYPLRVRPVFFSARRKGPPPRPRAVGRGGARERAQFSPQAETELSGLCDDDGAAP